MIKHIENKNMGRSDLNWLQSIFHFSFAEYQNRENMNFGVLRVLNDDLVEQGTGFEMHPHRDMEIISYVVKGQLTHQDSMSNKKTLSRGMVQYLSAGTGILHSEHNFGHEQARFLQIWIPPNQRGLTPNYGDYSFEWKARDNRWLHMVSSTNGNAPVKINQDANIYSLALEKGLEIEFDLDRTRQAYLVQVEGSSTVTGTASEETLKISEKDAVEITSESFNLKASEDSHYILIEMAKS